MTDVVFLAMEARELHKMIPKFQSETLRIELVAEAQRNRFTLTFGFGIVGHNHVHRIHLPQEGGRFHASCHEFLNNDVCNFLAAHAGSNQLQHLQVKGLHHIQHFSKNVIASMSGKGITSVGLCRPQTGRAGRTVPAAALFVPVCHTRAKRG